MITLKRHERLKKQFDEALEKFGSPELNMAEKRRMLKQLRDLEQEMDKYYNIGENHGIKE